MTFLIKLDEVWSVGRLVISGLMLTDNHNMGHTQTCAVSSLCSNDITLVCSLN